MKKEKNVVMLATQKASNLYKADVSTSWLVEGELYYMLPHSRGQVVELLAPDNSQLSMGYNEFKANTTPQHLHITSPSDRISEGDWHLDNIKGYECIEQAGEDWCLTKDHKKIIASTDPDLDLPKPSNEFIKAYVKSKGNIYSVMVEYLEAYSSSTTYDQPDREIPERIKIAPDRTITISAVHPYRDHLKFIYNRMVNIHSENPDVDYMLKFNEIIDSI